MTLAYKALRLADATDAMLGRFPYAITVIGITAIVTMFATMHDSIDFAIAWVVMISFGLTAVIGLVINVINLVSRAVLDKSGYTEIELERWNLA